jgi:nicotinamidase-related amidase
MIDQLEAAIEQAKRANLLILYAQQIYDPNQLTSLQKLRYANHERTITCDIRTPGADFYRIRPTPGLIYQKTNFNVFSNKDFCRQLERHDINTIVLTGVDTQYCIETAARSAFDLGYRVIVPRDLVATNAKHRTLHERTLELIDRTFGTTTSAEELIRVWQ